MIMRRYLVKVGELHWLFLMDRLPVGPQTLEEMANAYAAFRMSHVSVKSQWYDRQRLIKEPIVPRPS
jgi:hypothetical protein